MKCSKPYKNKVALMCLLFLVTGEEQTTESVALSVNAVVDS